MRRLWVHGRWAVALVVLVFLAGCFSRPEQEPSAPSPPPRRPHRRPRNLPQRTPPYRPRDRKADRPASVGGGDRKCAGRSPAVGPLRRGFYLRVPRGGGIPRFLAVFHSGMPDEIGPVRSARPYFIEVARAFGAVLVHAGGATKRTRSSRAGTRRTSTASPPRGSTLALSRPETSAQPVHERRKARSVHGRPRHSADGAASFVFLFSGRTGGPVFRRSPGRARAHHLSGLFSRDLHVRRRQRGYVRATGGHPTPTGGRKRPFSWPTS